MTLTLLATGLKNSQINAITKENQIGGVKKYAENRKIVESVSFWHHYPRMGNSCGWLCADAYCLSVTSRDGGDALRPKW